MRRVDPRKSVGLAVIALAVIGSLAALKWAPLPYLVAAALWCATGLFGVFTARGQSLKALWFNVAAIAAVLGCCEAWFAYPSDGTRIDYEPEYHVFHDTLGHAPRKSNRSRAQRHHGDLLVYDAEYTIDERGLRVSPPHRPTSVPVIFFGGSFTFGEGLDDDEAMPHILGTIAEGRYAVYNFGYHGYGPHQMLAAIEDDLVAEIVDGSPKAVVYMAIHDHVNRAAALALFGFEGPRYVMAESGEVTRRGRLSDAIPRETRFERQLKKSHMYRAWHFRRPTLLREHYDLFVAIVVEARDAMLRRHPETEFHVILWSRNEEFLARGDELRGRGIPVHEIGEIIPDLGSERYRIHAHDPHPSRLANERIARYVLEEILDR